MRRHGTVAFGLFTGLASTFFPLLLWSQTQAADSLDHDLLWACVGSGARLAEVRSLVERGANPNATNASGDSPLQYAAVYGRLDIVEFLLEHHADPNIQGPYYKTPLYCALLNDNIAIADLLLTHGANIETGDREPLLGHIAFAGKINGVEFLLKHGAKVNARDADGSSALTHASAAGEVAMVGFLLDHGADIGAVNKNGDTALHWAAINGQVGVIEVLLKRGADINAGANYGLTPLDEAMLHRRVDAAALLKEHGAKPRESPIVDIRSAPVPSFVGPGLELLCNGRAIADYLIEGELQKALDVSIECEDKDERNITESFAEIYLKGQYMASAQILIEQGKFDMARDRLSRAKKIKADSFLVNLGELTDTTEGYLLERSGNTAEAVKFYSKINKPYAVARLGAIYLREGHHAKARRAIVECLKSDPSNAEAHAILGEILEGTDKSAALKEYEIALGLTSAERGNPTVVAVVYLEVARAKRGIARLKQE
jgi:tetratricopeptide (TPR) repeat protein